MGGELPTEQVGIFIPYEPDKFGEFLSQLLKTPRRISRYKLAEFVIDLDRLMNFVYLIEQRLGEQHSYSQIQFVAVVRYSSGRTHTLTSKEQLLSYAETENNKCLNLSLVLVYLIKLPREEVPSRQQIKLEFYATPDKRSKENHARRQDILYTAYERFALGDGLSSRNDGVIGYEVEHTHVSWGNDVANLLDTAIDAEAIQDRRADFFRQYGTLIVVTIFVLLIALA